VISIFMFMPGNFLNHCHNFKSKDWFKVVINIVTSLMKFDLFSSFFVEPPCQFV